ncbi:hypothetical protein EPUS_06668 [Endocarpon pusillum Z07020]|uniref:D-isomer specific 2-hydroxyacid dehydrogenase NAD-binding domain-containing protein n=1 Tax=Endocarpon pusillum (strain Z07020 / HMAS-L-300199) TaxID=1263415 RepID=U1GBB2_ENDPU|nr:uncharacterized protein EPUS_06668 [Endocarpon pusillum Z07020]ERF68981.1 hypothetical protein EPUS_06668 [Endocarpon pusillum Z07020]
MGGGMPRENLLIILPFPEDKAITENIRKRFPYVDVKYHQLTQTNWSFEAEQGLPKGCFKPREEAESSLTQQSWPDLFKDTTILATFGSFPSTPEDAPNLNLIHLLSAGIDHFVSHPLFTQTNIPITTSSGIHGPTISEWILMSTLVLSKSYKKMYELQKQHKWGTPHKDFPQASDLVGKKVGIAGYGSIGRQFARVFTSLGCQIYAYTSSPRPTPSSRADKGYHLPHLGDPDGTLPTAWYSGTTKSDLHTFLSQDLDILAISLPLTPSTRGMFGKEEWDLLSHRQSHLIHALKTAQLSGAALDVTDPEPLPPASELWDMENVVLTPHMSALTADYLERALGGVLVENLRRRESGVWLVNLVDRKHGY